MAIQRIKTAKEDGWQARVGEGKPGQSKYFAMKKHGGVRKAYAKALRAERALLREHNAEAAAQRQAKLRTNRNNKSGLPGFRFAWCARHPGGEEHLHLIVSLRAPGKLRRFSLNTWGYEEAIREGLRARRADGLRVPPLANAVELLWRHYRVVLGAA